ncbi:hypothetical protein K491DRAFT_713064 [Lophiostoma macrostomum CBS 122681]|uniref:Uncharacterized protein n=1 Tax=Lophiostoma macrostomum CBS 122681 TaxID=1314788 RepID=A0A6A6TJB2_9PLEO|nr:hypothetical protein K491DRAFT_713064 [Lophiostoma macrostomum CBS 122681]
MRRYCSSTCQQNDRNGAHKHHCAFSSRVSRLLASASSQNYFCSFADILTLCPDKGNFGLVFLDRIVYVKVFRPWSRQTHSFFGPFLDRNVTVERESVTVKNVLRILEEEGCFLAKNPGLWNTFLKHNPIYTFEKLRVPVPGGKGKGKDKGRIMELSVVVQDSLDAVKLLRQTQGPRPPQSGKEGLGSLKVQSTFAVHTITPLRKYKPSELPHPTASMEAVDVQVHATFASAAQANRCAKDLVLKWEREEFPDGLAVCNVLVEPRYEGGNYGFVGDAERVVRRIVKVVENETV